MHKVEQKKNSVFHMADQFDGVIHITKIFYHTEGNIRNVNLIVFDEIPSWWNELQVPNLSLICTVFADSPKSLYWKGWRLGQLDARWVRWSVTRSKVANCHSNFQVPDGRSQCRWRRDSKYDSWRLCCKAMQWDKPFEGKRRNTLISV